MITQTNYRNDIQGLRAIAIVLVVGAHADITGFSAGFIGVDIFFVISGYLITRILLNEKQTSGKINFLLFYSRRLQRLLPALLTMIILTSLMVRNMLPEAEHEGQLSAAVSASIWVSNLYFAFNNTNYFDQSLDYNAFLHTWSLSVEEQFYLVWPLFLLIFVTQKKSNNILAVLILLAISFAACLAISSSKANFAFYLTPFRVWQFALGATVYLAAELTNNLSRKAKDTLSYSGILLIAIALILIEPTVAYPGAWAIFPTLGASLILMGETGNNSGMINKALCSPVLQRIGNISYSLYLWHWPIFVLGYVYFGEHTLIIKLSLIALSWLIAVMSFHWVEQPFRNISALKKKPVFALSIFVLLTSTTAIVVGLWKYNSQEILSEERSPLYTKAKADLPVIYSMGCDDWIASSEATVCSFGLDSASKTAVLMGDSVAAQWVPALIKLFAKNEWKLLVITKSSCPMIDKTIYYKQIGRDYTECTEWKNKVIGALSTHKPDILIVGHSEAYDIPLKDWQRYSTPFYEKIAPISETIYVLRPTPILSIDGPLCLVRNDDNMEACTTTNGTSRNSEIWSTTLNAIRRYKNMHIVDMNDVICPDNKCAAIHDGVITYRDTQHLTATYVEFLTPQLESKFSHHAH